MRKPLYKFFALFLAALLLGRQPLLAAPTDSSPTVSAASAILMEQSSGQVLFSKAPDVPLPIASITKIMTALVVLENCELDKTVRIAREWCGVEGAAMGLQAGGSFTVRELLYGLLLSSGNDAAVALACYAAGSVSEFASWMNEKAVALGMKNSHFVNPHGLTQEGHYASARDMALLTCAAMKNSDYLEICGTKTARLGGQELRNHNKLLWSCDGVFGGKTGYTVAAGRTLVSYAERDGVRLVCVTLNDPDDWNDHTALFDWGYGSFHKVELSALRWQTQVISGVEESVGVEVSAPPTVLVRNEADLRWSVELPRFVYAPANRGDTIGMLTLYGDEQRLASCTLVFRESVALDESLPLRFWERLRWGWYYACRHGYSAPISWY